MLAIRVYQVLLWLIAIGSALSAFDARYEKAAVCMTIALSALAVIEAVNRLAKILSVSVSQAAEEERREAE